VGKVVARRERAQVNVSAAPEVDSAAAPPPDAHHARRVRVHQPHDLTDGDGLTPRVLPRSAHRDAIKRHAAHRELAKHAVGLLVSDAPRLVKGVAREEHNHVAVAPQQLELEPRGAVLASMDASGTFKRVQPGSKPDRLRRVDVAVTIRTDLLLHRDGPVAHDALGGRVKRDPRSALRRKHSAGIRYQHAACVREWCMYASAQNAIYEARNGAMEKTRQ
jgi:hypothetical protein